MSSRPRQDDWRVESDDVALARAPRRGPASQPPTRHRISGRAPKGPRSYASVVLRVRAGARCLSAEHAEVVVRDGHNTVGVDRGVARAADHHVVATAWCG